MNKQGPLGSVLFLLGLVTAIIGISYFVSNSDTRHKAKIYKLKNHHIVMQDDRGEWWEFVKNGVDIDFDIPTSATGRFTIPAGGNWRAATEEEEDEVNTNNQETQEEVTVSETESGAPDGSGDVSNGDSSGDSGGDSDGDGGGDGGE